MPKKKKQDRIQSWLEVAQERINAGENEIHVVADYGYVGCKAALSIILSIFDLHMKTLVRLRNAKETEAT